MPALAHRRQHHDVPAWRHGHRHARSANGAGRRAGPARLRHVSSIAGCTFNVAGAPHPCVSVNWVQTATRVKHGGDFALNEASVGLCVAGDQTPQGTVLIAATQTQVSGL